jgi:hypothetical protein
LSKKNKPHGRTTGISLGSVFVTMAIILLLGVYVGILIYGDNSIMALENLKSEKNRLTLEAKKLKSENQKLQKEYFELKNLEPNEEQ